MRKWPDDQRKENFFISPGSIEYRIRRNKSNKCTQKIVNRADSALVLHCNHVSGCSEVCVGKPRTHATNGSTTSEFFLLIFRVIDKPVHLLVNANGWARTRIFYALSGCSAVDIIVVIFWYAQPLLQLYVYNWTQLAYSWQISKWFSKYRRCTVITFVVVVDLGLLSFKLDLFLV